ncbi:amino acid adenylation domain-containing protein [Amycolatopsis sp. cmx-4-83]|uniref:amino acid adenylation domain-containing protein n=1 Tax=Amycolatopsis sp. cmx-4-83 TaxID=2790940 RepID=UPI00397DB872
MSGEAYEHGEAARSLPLALPRPAAPSFRQATEVVAGGWSAEVLAAALAVVLARHNDAESVELAVAVAGEDSRQVRFSTTAKTSFAQLMAQAGTAAGERGGCPVVVADHKAGLGRVLAAADLAVLTEPATSTLQYVYATDRFDATSVRRIAGQVRAVAAAGTARPETLLDELDPLGPEERADLLALAAAETSTVDGRIEELADRQDAGRAAVTHAGRTLTYHELRTRANWLAHRLRARGIGVGDRVGVLVERSPELVTAFLAVLKAGAAYVPIDPAAPLVRQAEVAELAGLSLTIATSEEAPGTTPVEVLPPVIPAVEDAPEHGGTAADAAYVLFTSGSTGRPKGVEVTHAGVVRLFGTTRALVGFGRDDVWANLHSPAFDASVWEIYGALLHGGRVVIAPPDTARDPGEVLALLDRERVSLLTISPTAFEGFRDAVLERGAPPPSLRFVALCAEALNVGTLRPWFERFGDEHPVLANMYGITETTVHSTYHRIRAGELHDGRSRIGRGLPDTPVYVVDGRGRLVPFGVPGEIRVGGPGVAAGYAVAAAEDHARFAPDEHSAVAGARVYRSGDRARWLPDGSLEYLGRLDRQLKIRGYRIEPAEVENTLLAHPDVTAARVWAVRRPERPPVLAAAVVPAAGAVLQAADLRAFAASRLPGHLVPAGVVVVPHLPQTANGKLDTSALPDPFATAEQEPGEDTGGTAALVAEVMADVLGVRRLGTRANFFEHGGDSITAVRLVTRLRDRNVEVDLATVYRARTPSALAAAEPSPAAPAPRPGAGRAGLPPGAVDSFPATRLQRGMFLHSVGDGEQTYHDVLSYTLDTALEPGPLATALRAVTAAHPVLRSAFALDRSDPRQVVHEHAEIAATFVDLRGLPAGERATAVEEWAGRERLVPFDWTVPGLLRVFVHRTGDTECVLSLSVHHAILDGWSAATLVTELLLAHSRIAGRQAPPADVLRRYAEAEQSAERDESHRAFWRDRLEDAIPTSIGMPGVEGSPPGEVSSTVPADVARRLRETARAAGVPVKSIYLAAHLALLAFASGAPDVLTGLVTNGRPEEPGGDEALGLFLNTVPLRLRVAGQTWPELARDVFDQETALAAHRRYPFERIQADGGFSRLCPTAFNFTRFHVYDRLAAAGIRITGLRYHEQTDFGLLLAVHENPFDGTVSVTLAYRPEEVDAGRARTLAEVYLRLVHQAAAGEDGPVARSLGTWARAAGLTAEAPEGPPPTGCGSALSLVVPRFEADPDAVLVVEQDRRWTRREIAAAVAGTRAELRDIGVTRGSRVASFASRGAGPLITLLAVWSLGAVYVPIDTALPPERVRTLLATASCSAAVTSPGAAPTGWAGPSVVLGSSDDNPVPWEVPDAGDEAYVLFTSGSTGVPKAVAVAHRTLGNLIAWQLTRPGWGGSAVVSQFAPLMFDVSLQEMLTAAAGGGALAVVPEPVRRNPQALLEFLAGAAVEIVFLPPVALRQLATAWEAFGSPGLKVRQVITAGEALVVTDQVRRLAAATGASLVNQYGPTETHVVTAHHLGPDPSAWPERPPIGLPVAGAGLRVLDELGRPVMAGARGELHVSGPGVALGYLGASSGRFHELAGVRHYRTGDVVRVTGRGLEFAGRADRQVKVRGFRVEPDEVAAVLLRHSDVDGCAVRAVDDRDAGTELAAYVVPRTAALTTSAVRDHLAGLLPGYAVPRYVELLDRLPLTASGKLDVRALRPPRTLRPRPAEAHGATPAERRVLTVWADVLGHHVSSPTLSFFEAGGTSLLALPLYLKLRDEFGAAFPLHDLFRYPTARGIARFLTTRSASTSRHGHGTSDRLDRIALVADRTRTARKREKTDD